MQRGATSACDKRAATYKLPKKVKEVKDQQGSGDVSDLGAAHVFPKRGTRNDDNDKRASPAFA